MIPGDTGIAIPGLIPHLFTCRFQPVNDLLSPRSPVREPLHIFDARGIMAITTIWHDTRKGFRMVARVEFVQAEPSVWDEMPFREVADIVSGAALDEGVSPKPANGRGRKRKPGLKSLPAALKPAPV